ncbi:MAG TPA: metal-dependent phosphohydrolase [Dehalococcoidia bacterium]|nr:metal-dependent phosphohydrolase [Dehalococcoidia bacterium]
MITVPELAAEALGSLLGSEMQRAFGSSHTRLTELIPSIAHVALECIGNSDALYHNVEHTMLVTLAGHDILRGRALLSRTAPVDWAHVIVACLMHDIGFVRGLLPGDDSHGYVADAGGRKVPLARGASDAALTPHHVDRSKLFVLERIADIDGLDAQRIALAIEFTRFPVQASAADAAANEDGALLRAADLIGQLGDPHYLRKANALWCEFEETGINRQLGYASPADVVEQYPQFYWNSVSPHVQTAIRYLEVTASGRQWLANLYSNVFRAERAVEPVSGEFAAGKKA